MSWDFFVPVCVGDLVKTGGINQYIVQDVLSPAQLPSHLSSKHPHLDKLAKFWTPALVTMTIFCLFNRVQGRAEEPGTFMCTETLWHRLQCAAVSLITSNFMWFNDYNSRNWNGLSPPPTPLFLRHCNSVEIGVKEDALELLVQG